MTASIRTIMLWLGTRVIVFHIVLVMILYLSIDHVRILTKMVNFHRPTSMDYLFDLSDGKVPLSVKQLRPFKKYYEIVGRYVSVSPIGCGVLGFVNYQMGEVDKAERYYNKALQLYPTYSNYYYDLALISLKKNDYAKMRTLLTFSLQTVTSQHDLSMFYLSQDEAKPFFARLGFNQGRYAEKQAGDRRDMVFLLAASVIYAGDYGVAAQVIGKILQAEGLPDTRLVCLQEYISFLRAGLSREGSSSFQVCQKALGWSSSGKDEKGNDDPLGLKRLRLKLW